MSCRRFLVWISRYKIIYPETAETAVVRKVTLIETKYSSQSENIFAYFA